MKLLKTILISLGALVFLFFLFILHSTMSDYRPKEINLLRQVQNPDTIKITGDFDIMIWNIGYAGLDKEMDFFYDGGEKVRTPETQLLKNFQNISTLIHSNDTSDFILLQEVDRASHRSYNINQLRQLRLQLNDFACFFGKNYDVSFVPVPINNPMGKVLSGIVAFSDYHPETVIRYSFPGNYAWPKSLFMLDRCFVVCRFPTSNGKEFVLINTHNEAYDDGSIRKKQMEYLKEFVVAEYATGNYILVGGDWNQCPPSFIPRFKDQPFDTLNLSYIPDDYLPDDWKWGYDPAIPSNRRIVTNYKRGETLTTVIDFYLLSPNLDLISTKTMDLGFENSDHHPVLARFKFIKL